LVSISSDPSTPGPKAARMAALWRGQRGMSRGELGQGNRSQREAAEEVRQNDGGRMMGTQIRAILSSCRPPCPRSAAPHRASEPTFFSGEPACEACVAGSAPRRGLDRGPVLCPHLDHPLRGAQDGRDERDGTYCGVAVPSPYILGLLRDSHLAPSLRGRKMVEMGKMAGIGGTHGRNPYKWWLRFTDAGFPS